MMRVPLKQTACQLWREERGSSGTEFVMLLPILALMLFGGVGVGQVLHDYNLADQSIRHAVRYLSRVDITCAGATGTLSDPNDENIARNLAITGETADPTGPGDYLLGYWDDKVNDIDVVIDCVPNPGALYQGVYNGFTDIPRITMTGRVPADIFYGSTILGKQTFTMMISHQEAALFD